MLFVKVIPYIKTGLKIFCALFQGCDVCDDDNVCNQTTPDGAGVADADTVIYYTFSATGVCALPSNATTLAFATHCQLESTLDRYIICTI